jgi:histidine triad (HIT) family protein
MAGLNQNDCPFCLCNWGQLTILDRGAGVAVIRPLNPVTDGHVLVISGDHTSDAADSPIIAAGLMFSAALWVQRTGIEANIITSIGALATQTVRHTHLHVVPRRPGDGLQLPWSGQDGR